MWWSKKKAKQRELTPACPAHSASSAPYAFLREVFFPSQLNSTFLSSTIVSR